MPASRDVDVQAFLNEHPFSGFQWLIFAPVLYDRPAGWIRHGRHRLHRPVADDGMGDPRPALAPVLSAALFGLAVGALGGGPAGGPLRPQGDPGRLRLCIGPPASPPHSRAI